MIEAAEQVDIGDLLPWQEAARQRAYDKVCALCGQPARMLIAYAGWCCDECAMQITIESNQRIKDEMATASAST
jgi:ribosomal protein L37AE/L43A